MAFIYLCSGNVLRVAESRQAVANDIAELREASVLEYEVDFPAGGATHPGKVTIVAHNIAVVSEQPLPNPLR